MDIQKERAAFEREWLLMGGDFQNYAVVDGMYVLNPNIASNVGSNFKELAERALNSSWALWLIQARQKQAEIDQLKSQAIPEGFVLVPRVLTHKHAVKISDDADFFETYQTILHESDVSEDSVSVLLRIAHKAMIEAAEDKGL